MKLLIDIGNQRVKWATSEQLNLVDEAATSRIECDKMMPNKTIGNQIINTRSADLVTQLMMSFSKLPIPESVWVSCVSAAAIKKNIVEMCHVMWQLSPTFIRAEGDVAGVENGYENPATLGADRWAANIGGRHIAGRSALVVIDAGTAVTIDYINQAGRFSGGLIFPGAVTMIESLHAATGQIKRPSAPSLSPLPLAQIQLMNTNTKSALENGVMLAVVAGIDRAIEQYLRAEGSELKVIITGGDAECIASLSTHDMKHESNLVLLGLLLLSEEAP